MNSSGESDEALEDVAPCHRSAVLGGTITRVHRSPRMPAMYGPQPLGKWSSIAAPNSGRRLDFLCAGKRYRVMREFVDFDNDIHPRGEEWTFLGYSYLPYDDGTSLFVSLDGVHEWHIRLQGHPDQQADVLNNLEQYLSEI